MKLQGIAAGHHAVTQPLAEQAPAGEPSAQAAGQIAQRDAALREALPSRQAGDGASRAKRTGTSVLRSIANTSQGSSAHGSPRMQAMVVRQSDDMQVQDDGTDDSIALPDELDGAIADWASAAVGNANNESDADAEVRERPSHQRVTRDGHRQQQRGQQQPQQQPQQQSEQESPARVTDRRDGKQAAQARTDGLADQAQASGQPPPAGLASESPWSLHPGARSTARIAPIAAAAPAQRQVAELDSRLSAHTSKSDTVTALMWALAAMVVAIIATLLLTVFSDHETDTDTGMADPGSHEATRRDERKTR